MNETRYLVDNNALLALGRARRCSSFFLKYCRVPSDVLYEARDLPDAVSLSQLDYDVTPSVLERLRTVMSSIPVSDTTLVDLYRNKGTADPVLIASALDAADRESALLFPDAWVIATADRALRETAHIFGIDTASPAQLAATIDAAGT